MKTAIIYNRVSTEEQAKGMSLSTQDADNRASAARLEASLAYDPFQDKQTAKNDNRPGLIAALDAARRLRPDYFIVWKLDRVARNSEDGHAIRRTLRLHGTQLVSTTEPAAGSDPLGQLAQTILMGVAQFDNEVRAARCRRGMEAVAAAGGWAHKAPAGFLSARSGRLPILKPDPKTAPVVARAFRALADGRTSQSKAGAMLVAAGISSQSASRIFRQPVYAGVIRSPLTDGKEVPAAFPGIVSRETFDAVQEALRAFQPRGRQSLDFHLAGVARCAVCGGPIRGGWSSGRGGKRYAYYDCKHGHVRSKAGQAQEDLVEIIVGQWATGMRDLRSLVAREAAARADISRAQRDAADRRRSQAEARLSRLADGFADGVIDGDTYQEKAAAYRLEIRAAANDARVHQAGIDALLTGIDRIVETLSRPLEMWKSLDSAGRRKMVTVLKAHLVITPDGRCRNAASGSVISHLTGAKGTGSADGRPGGSRTRDPQIRNLVLCPSELLAYEPDGATAASYVAEPTVIKPRCTRMEAACPPTAAVATTTE